MCWENCRGIPFDKGIYHACLNLSETVSRNVCLSSGGQEVIVYYKHLLVVYTIREENSKFVSE